MHCEHCVNDYRICLSFVRSAFEQVLLGLIRLILHQKELIEIKPDLTKSRLSAKSLSTFSTKRIISFDIG